MVEDDQAKLEAKIRKLQEQRSAIRGGKAGGGKTPTGASGATPGGGRGPVKPSAALNPVKTTKKEADQAPVQVEVKVTKNKGGANPSTTRPRGNSATRGNLSPVQQRPTPAQRFQEKVEAEARKIKQDTPEKQQQQQQGLTTTSPDKSQQSTTSPAKPSGNSPSPRKKLVSRGGVNKAQPGSRHLIGTDSVEIIAPPNIEVDHQKGETEVSWWKEAEKNGSKGTKGTDEGDPTAEAGAEFPVNAKIKGTCDDLFKKAEAKRGMKWKGQAEKRMMEQEIARAEQKRKEEAGETVETGDGMMKITVLGPEGEEDDDKNNNGGDDKKDDSEDEDSSDDDVWRQRIYGGFDPMPTPDLGDDTDEEFESMLPLAREQKEQREKEEAAKNKERQEQGESVENEPKIVDVTDELAAQEAQENANNNKETLLPKEADSKKDLPNKKPVKGHHPDPLVAAFSRVQAPQDIAEILNAAHRQAHAAASVESSEENKSNLFTSRPGTASAGRGNADKENRPQTVTESNFDVTVRRSIAPKNNSNDNRPGSSASTSGTGDGDNPDGSSSVSTPLHPGLDGDMLVLEDLGSTNDLLIDDDDNAGGCLAARLVQQFTAVATAGLKADREGRAREAITNYEKGLDLAKKLRSCGDAAQREQVLLGGLGSGLDGTAGGNAGGRKTVLGALGKSVLDKARVMEGRIKFLETRAAMDDARARGVKPPSRGGMREGLDGERVGGVKCPLDVRIRSSVKKL